MDNSFDNLLQGSKSPLILLGQRPKFDEVAAGLALYLILNENKPASIASGSPMVVEYNRLIAVNKVEEKLGNKNLVIYFKDYNAENVEKVSADVEGDEFRITIVPQSGAPAPKSEQIKFDHSGVNADLVILIGGVSLSNFSFLEEKDLQDVEIVHIGVQEIDSNNKKFMSLASPASTVSERLVQIASENNLKITDDAATNLIAGIEEGTQNFTADGVQAPTFEAMANLMKLGGVRKSGEVKRENFPQGSIPGESPKDTQDDKGKKTPKDWTQPKIYKGTSVS